MTHTPLPAGCRGILSGDSLTEAIGDEQRKSAAMGSEHNPDNIHEHREGRIVDTAIALAEEVGWEGVRLRVVAERLGMSLAEVSEHFRDLDAVADAWFARARQAMLRPMPPGFAGLPARQRLETLLLRWFDATSAHRRVSVQMLAGKLWPFHPHHWAPLIFNLSRTILWLRDAAALDAGSPRRELEEMGLTWLFLLTLLVWAGDESDGQAGTRWFLRRRLADADVLMALLFGPEPDECDGYIMTGVGSNNPVRP